MSSSLPERLLRAGASRTFSFVLLGAWAGLIAMWLIPFQLTGLPEAQVSTIASTWWPFRVLYVVLGAATLCCVVVRARTDMRRVRGRVRLPADLSATHAPTLTTRAIDLDMAVARLDADGWHTARESAAAAAWRWRGSLLGGSVFHVGIAVFMLAIALAPLLSFTADFRLIESEQVGPGQEGEEGALRGLVADATLVTVEPRYFGDVLLFEKLDATWARVDGRSETFSLASPLWVDPITTVSIQDFGLAPHFVVRRGTELVQDSVAAMSIFPPGAEDEIVLANADLIVAAVAFTDYGVVDGRDVSLSYNIRSPRLRVSISRASDPGRVVARGLLAPGEAIALDGDGGTPTEIVFEDLRRYGTFRVARSFAMPLLVVGGLLMVVGMGVRILRPRTELVLWQSADGLSVACRVDKVGVSAEDTARRALGIVADEQ